MKKSKLAICEIKCSVDHLCDGRRYRKQTIYIVLYALLIVVGLNLFVNATSIGTAIGFATVHNTNLFGRQRVWGTIGYGTTAFVASRLYAHFKTDYVYIIIFICSSILTIIITSFIRIRPNKHKESEVDKEDISSRQKLNDISKNKNGKISGLVLLLKKLDVIIFLLVTFIWGMSSSVLDPVSFYLLFVN